MNLHEINKQTDRIEKLLALFPVSRPFLLESGKVLNIKEKNDSMQERIYFLLDGAMIGSVGEGEKNKTWGLPRAHIFLDWGS
jgi:hypothetical protein